MQGVNTPISITAIILGSVAVSAIVSSIMTLLGQFLKRKARRKELLLSKAVKLAMAHSDKLLEVAKLGRTEVFIPEHIRLVQSCFAGMSQMLLDGYLPKGILTTDISRRSRIIYPEVDEVGLLCPHWIGLANHKELRAPHISSLSYATFRFYIKE